MGEVLGPPQELHSHGRIPRCQHPLTLSGYCSILSSFTLLHGRLQVFLLLPSKADSCADGKTMTTIDRGKE